MCFHPAYPSAADLHREADAEDRDLRDLTTLRALRGIVTQALDAAERCAALRHPDRRLQTEDVIDLLAGALIDIDGEADRLRRSPLVLEMEG
jgi:hypothetical protein